MKIKLYSVMFLGLIFSFLTMPETLFAVEPLPKNLINFTSPKGQILLKINLNLNALKLISHFTSQENLGYCGPASAVMILNSTNIVPPVVSPYAPYGYFTQDNFFNDTVKKIITPEIVKKQGMTLTELGQSLKVYGLKVQIIPANKTNLTHFRNALKNALLNNQFIIVNFLRTALQQQGSGHHSPVVAYDVRTDRFLLLDVARFKYPSYWVKSEDLWRSVNTIADPQKKIYRGFLIITS